MPGENFEIYLEIIEMFRTPWGAGEQARKIAERFEEYRGQELSETMLPALIRKVYILHSRIYILNRLEKCT